MNWKERRWEYCVGLLHYVVEYFQYFYFTLKLHVFGIVMATLYYFGIRYKVVRP
jgi:hypothetical protein